MTTYQIYEKLKRAAEIDPEKLIDVWNERCTEWRYDDDMVYPNDIENLKTLLPSDPEEAFSLGRQASDNYNYTDDWLSIDGYGRPVTCNTWSLTDKFIMLGDLARYLNETKDDDELQELWDELDVADDDDDDEEADD